MKLVILGGSAQSTPQLWSYLIHDARLQNLHVVLAGRDRRRLQAVSRACRLLAEGGANRLELALLDRREDWTRFADADVFLIQIRVGGYQGRSRDESFPLRYGVCGDEGLGPGGVSAGIRNWAGIAPVLESIDALQTAPLILMLSSPVSVLVRAARLAFPRLNVAGICELPWTTLSGVGRDLGVEPSRIRFDYLGVNHLGWFHELAAGGRDLLEEYAGLRAGSPDFPSGALLRSCRGLPLKYLRLHYDQQQVLAEQRAQPQTRAERLQQLSRRALRVYREGDRRSVVAALAARPAPWYRYAVGPLLASLAGEPSHASFFLSVRNAGYEPRLDGDDVLECPHVVEGGRLRRLSRRAAAPAHILELTARFVRYERLASRAVSTVDLEDVHRALVAHPWLEGVSRTAEMAREIVDHGRAAAA